MIIYIFAYPHSIPLRQPPPRSMALHPNEAEVRPGLPSACEGFCEIPILQGGEGGVTLGERGPIDPIDIMGKADGERLAVGVLGVIALLGEIL